MRGRQITKVIQSIGVPEIAAWAAVLAPSAQSKSGIRPIRPGAHVGRVLPVRNQRPGLQPDMAQTASVTPLVDLPRFRGGVRAWDQAIYCDGIMSSRFAIVWFGRWRSHSFVLARTMVELARAAGVKDGPARGRPKGLSLTGASTAAGW